MALPKVSQPVFHTTLPSCNKPVAFRQLTVREEKLILTAQASSTGHYDTSIILAAVKQLLNNCIVEPANFNPDKMAAVDLEWLFIQIRAKSVSNIVEILLADPPTANAPDPKDRKKIPVLIDLDKIQLHKGEISNKILIDEQQEIGIVMKAATFEVMERIEARTHALAMVREAAGQEQVEDSDLQLAVIEECMDAVWQGESVYPVTDEAPGETAVFLDGLNDQQIAKIMAYIEDQPYLYLDIEFADSQGKQHKLKLRGIADFFGS